LRGKTATVAGYELQKSATRKHGSGPKHTFGEAILVHADVDARRCAQLFKNVKRTVAGMTLYVNSNDWALRVSEILRGRPRCGRVAAVYDGVDTLDTSGMEKGKGILVAWSSSWNHDVFVRNPVVRRDHAAHAYEPAPAGSTHARDGAGSKRSRKHLLEISLGSQCRDEIAAARDGDCLPSRSCSAESRRACSSPQRRFLTRQRPGWLCAA